MDETKELIRRQKRKIKFIQISAVTFLDMIKDGEVHVKIEGGVPKDAKFEFAGHTEWGTLNIIFSSDVFPLVTEGDVIPEFMAPSITRLRQITTETRDRFYHLAGSYLNHDDRHIRDMAIMLQKFLQEE